jgi:hypothetical protein
MPKYRWLQVLNYEAIFNFDNDWKKVLGVMPEITEFRHIKQVNLPQAVRMK